MQFTQQKYYITIRAPAAALLTHSLMSTGRPAQRQRRSVRQLSEKPDASGRMVWIYQLLLTLQYGAQPLITKRLIGSGPYDL